MAISSASAAEFASESRLAALGLSSEIFHNGLRSGASRAANRSALALDFTPGSDVYHDGMENLHRILRPLGWRRVAVEKQPRFVHPAGIISFTVSSGVNVGKADMRIPRTRRKGPATRNSLAVQEPPSLFDVPDHERATRLAKAANSVPFYFLLCERVTHRNCGLLLEFSQPARMTKGGSVNEWKERIAVPYLTLEGDLSVFDDPDDDDAIDVSVEPR